MYKKTKLDIWLEIIIWLCFLALIIGSCTGCTNWEYLREEFDAQGNRIAYVKVKGSDVLQDSSIDEVSVVVTPSGTRRLSIGHIEKDTDEEATGAVVEAAVTGLVKAVVPIP